MLVREAMTTDVVTATPETPLVDLIDMMIEHDITGVPVVDVEGRVVGVATEADLVARQAHPTAKRPRLALLAELIRGSHDKWWTKAAGLTTASVMSSPAHTAYENETLQTAATRMLTLGIRRLPVLDDDGRLTGILSRHDLLVVAHRTDDVIARDVESALASPLRCPEDHGVRISCVAQGVVYIEGWTHTHDDAELIFDVLRAIPGVLDVRGGIGRRPLYHAPMDVLVTNPTAQSSMPEQSSSTTSR
jgi:CBS domain-containing protein